MVDGAWIQSKSCMDGLCGPPPAHLVWLHLLGHGREPHDVHEHDGGALVEGGQAGHMVGILGGATHDVLQDVAGEHLNRVVGGSTGGSAPWNPKQASLLSLPYFPLVGLGCKIKGNIAETGCRN